MFRRAHSLKTYENAKRQTNENVQNLNISTNHKLRLTSLPIIHFKIILEKINYCDKIKDYLNAQRHLQRKFMIPNPIYTSRHCE